MSIHECELLFGGKEVPSNALHGCLQASSWPVGDDFALLLGIAFGKVVGRI